MRVIPGEKRKIRKEIDKVREEKGPLRKEEKKAIAKKVHKKMKRRAIFIAIAAAAGIGGATTAHKMLDAPKEPIDRIESESKTEQNEFKDRIKVDVNELQANEQKQSQIEQEISNLETKEDVLAYLKDMYIDKYEEKTGDDTLTTEDIGIVKSNEDYTYIDKENGDIILHDELPNVTEQNLVADNVEYEIGSDAESYKVRDNEGNIIDAVVMEDGLVRAIPGNQYNEMKNYDSVLDDMGDVIPAGLTYYDRFDNNDEKAKNDFVKAVEEYEQSEKQKADTGREF